MSSNYEKSVKGATKVKQAAPKSKYIEHILIATHTGEAGVAEIFRTLQHRLRDSTWTIVFKALIVVHIMIREGSQDATLLYLAPGPKRRLAINNFTEVQAQGQNIRSYSDYLIQRAISYSSTKVDYVRKGEKRLKSLNVEKGLLRETESVQDQIKALLKCNFLSHEPENEITLTAFRLLTMDLLALFHVMNEGTINVLEHFFEMSKPDAERALRIYRQFCKQTTQVVEFLSVARQYEHATRLEIPKIKHAPTSLTNSLEEYIKDPDFDINRRQYQATQEAKRTGKPVQTIASASKEATSSATEAKKPEASKPVQKGPAPDLIDFFESIEQNQTPMAQPTYQQQQFAPQMMGQQPMGFGAQATGMGMGAQPQPGYGIPTQATGTNPFLQMQQPQATGIQPGFGGGPSLFGAFGPQPQRQPTFASSLGAIPQSSVASFGAQQQTFGQGMGTNGTNTPLSVQTQSTNPFRQSMIANSTTGTSFSSFGGGVSGSPVAAQSTNPFARPGLTSMPTGQSSPFGSQPSPFSPSTTSAFGPSPFQSQAPPQQPQSMLPQATGTNPFAKLPQAPQSQPTGAFGAPQNAALMPQATGTNPFRQSAFLNQATGAGWQNSAQGTIGGMNTGHFDTVPVFPRPGA